ncbi:MAG: peptidyl-prolyl cis-trans isomerase [Sphingomicrobium sp.]
MLSILRRLSKTKFGMLLIAFPFMMIIGGFMLGDIQNFGSGDIGFGSDQSALAQVGKLKVTDNDIDQAMQRQLEQARQTNPEATYATIANDFDTLLTALIDQRALLAFAHNSGFVLSKRLIDGEISQLPQAQGLNGKFSQQGYQAFLSQQRMSDFEVRQIVRAGLLQRLLLTPVASNARVSVGMATPFASMLLEAREGQVVAIPVELFTAGLQPKDSEVQKYYSANRQRYVTPEQRVLRFARVGPESVASVQASDQEIADFYKAQSAAYAAKDSRDLSQVVVPDRGAADATAARAKSGSNLASAANAVAGAGAAVSTLKGQSRDAYAGVAGKAVADAVFAAPNGAIVGPVQSDFGWTVVRVDSVTRTGGKSLEAARSEIAARLTVDKRKAALEEKVNQLQEAIDDGATFAEATQAGGLQASLTPMITAEGASLTNRSFRVPEAYAGSVRAGFEMAANDPPEIVTLPGDSGYIIVSPAEIVPAAPPPLASIRARVAADWVKSEGMKRAKAAADAIAAKAGKGVPLAQAIRESGVSLPPAAPVAARRMQIATAETPVPPAVQALFLLGQGKARTVPAPNDRGFVVVKVDKIIPGNALLQPSLIARMQTDMQGATSDAYAQQFIAAAGKYLKLERHPEAIAAAKKRIITPRI